MAEFELTKFVEDKDPYPPLLQIEWAYENNAIFKIKSGNMSLVDE